MATLAAAAPIIKVGGSLLSESWLSLLTGARVDRGQGTIGRAVLRFLDQGFVLSSSDVFAVGTVVTLTQYSSSTLLFSGEVTGVALEQASEYSPELVVTIDDLAHKLAHTTVSRTYLQMAPAELLRQATSASGLTLDATVSGAAQEYQLQAGTNLGFVEELAVRTGSVWWVEPPKTLKVKPTGTSTATTEITLGQDLVRFSVRASGRNADAVTVVGWDPAAQQKVVHTASTAATKESNFVDKFPGRGSDNSHKLVVAGLTPQTSSEAEAIAGSLLAESQASAVTARGTTLVNGAIAPGTSVKVAGAGPASGTYLVSEVQHVYDRRGFQTHFVCGSPRSRHLVDVLGPEPADAGFRVPGVITAVVTNVADDKKMGRAKVKYSTADGEIESPWARIVTLGAGAKRGMVFQPEVDDEVLVAFEHGDTRRPVILGGLFSDKIGLPTDDNVADGKVAFRRITSRLGHLLELADGTGATTQHVLLKVADVEHRIRLGADRLDLEVDKKPVKISNGKASIEFTEAGDITIKGVKVAVEASGSLDIKGAKVKVAGQSGVDVEGGQVNVKASMNLQLEGSIMAIVKGGLVKIN